MQVLLRGNKWAGCGSGAVHEPDVGLASGRLPPAQVRCSVAVKVADRLDGVKQTGCSRASSGSFRGTVHQINIRLPCGGVVEKNVRVAVAVEVTTFFDHPSRVRFGEYVRYG